MSVSSSPRAATAPKRPAWSTRASPRRTTASFTVCQSQPSSVATSSTLRAQCPTCLVTHRPVRHGIRGAAIRASSSLQVPRTHAAAGQRHRRSCPTSLVGRPNEGQVDQHHRPLVLQLCPAATVRALRVLRRGLDVDVDDWCVDETEHAHVGKPDQHLAHLGGIGDEVGRESAAADHAVTLASPPPKNADPVRLSDPKLRLTKATTDCWR